MVSLVGERSGDRLVLYTGISSIKAAKYVEHGNAGGLRFSCVYGVRGRRGVDSSVTWREAPPVAFKVLGREVEVPIIQVPGSACFSF